MNENQFEQFVAQMLSGMKAATDWTIETQRREYAAHDQKLAAAEAVLHKALDFVSRERQRLFNLQNDQQMRQLHETITRETQQLSRQPKVSGHEHTERTKQ